MHLKTQRRKSSKGGFGIIELLVVLSIMTFLTTIVMWNYRASLTTESVASGTRELRVLLRQAQLWANSSYPFPSDSTDSDRFNRGFGIHLSQSEPTEMIFYGGEDEVSTDYDAANIVFEDTLPVGSHIASMCSGTESVCSQTQTLEIFFRRPSLGAVINGGDAYARIEIAADSGNAPDRLLLVYSSGRVETMLE